MAQQLHKLGRRPQKRPTGEHDMLQPVDGALTTQSILPLLVLQDPHGLLQCLPASGRLALGRHANLFADYS